MTKHERPRRGFSEGLEGLAGAVTVWTGGSWAFAVALTAIVVWGMTGPVFGFSDTWQLTMNTAASQVTFLIAFLLQNTQNRDTRALH